MSDIDSGATTEIEKVIDATEEAPKSMDDTIRDTLRELQSKGKEIVDESGEVAPVKKTEKVAVEKPLIATGEPVAESVDQVKAPNTWKKEAQEAFIKADPVVRAEIARREADFHKGIEQYRNAATFAQSIDTAITPYKKTIESLGLSPDRAIAELMGADHRLRFGSQEEKAQYLVQLAQNYGIDLPNAAKVSENTDPRLLRMEQERNFYQTQLNNQQLMGQQQEMRALDSEIASFAADPKHSHFDSVKGHMAALLQAGQAQSLSDAYEQAIYANPTTRVSVLQQIETEKKAELVKKAAAAKSAASVNIRSRPSLPVAAPVGTMEETIRANYRRLTGAV